MIIIISKSAMITENLKRLLKWLPVMLFPLLILSCSDSDEKPAPDDEEPGEEEFSAWTPEQIAHSTLVGHFFDLIGTDENGNVYSPSKGIAINEAKPSERSEACDSYERALEQFELALPSGENDEQYIHRVDNGITVDLGNLGSVKFSSASGEGVVAKADIRLKDAPNYTLLYRNEESFGDNYSSDQNLYDLFYPGDLVYYRCPENAIINPDNKEQMTDRDKEQKVWQWSTCNDYCLGVVIEATAHSVNVLTNHYHYYTKFDKKKGEFDMHYKLVSVEGWRRVYNSWHSNRDLFLSTYENADYSVICDLKAVMEGGSDLETNPRYVVVEGDDFERKLSRKCWYSWQKRIKISDLKNGHFTTEYVEFAYKDILANTYKANGYYDVYRFTLTEFNREQAERLEVVYPKH